VRPAEGAPRVLGAGGALVHPALQLEHLVEAGEESPVESDLDALEGGEADEGEDARGEGDGQKPIGGRRFAYIEMGRA
jgi:hypothetical protein